MSPWYLWFSWRISSLSHSVIFLYFFALITEEGFLISSCYSLELCIQMLIFSFSPLLFASLLSSAICEAFSDNHFAFLHFFFGGWSWSLPLIQCHEPPSIVLQALCLSDRIPVIYLWLPLYNCKGFDLGHTWRSSGFPTFFNLSLNLAVRSSCFCWLYRASPSFAAKNIINLISVLAMWWCPCVESSLVLLEEGVCYDQCILLAKLC